MKKQIILLLSLLAVLFTGCSDQKAPATRMRWMEIKTATDNLVDALAYINQSSSKESESEDALAEPLAQATSTINACQTYIDALSAQKTVNVDPQLNDLAEKLIESANSILTQTKRGQDAIITAQRLMKEQQTISDPQNLQQLAVEVSNVLQEMNSVQQDAMAAMDQFNNNYQELETLRLNLNTQYGFELPPIKLTNQQNE